MVREPIIEWKDYSFQYQSQSEPTLRNIDLTIHKGERIIIVGASGCGKSTMVHCLNGLIPFSYPGKQEGSLKILGEEASELSIFELSQSVGTVLQDTDGQFIGMTVLEDIAFALENDCVPQEEMLKRTREEAIKVKIIDKLDAAPHELSGGQKQRVSLAGVLINETPILLFDEPLANLDPAAGKEAIVLIDEIQKKTDTTVIIIEHRLEDALYMGADRIILMEDGQIIEADTPTKLLAGTKLIGAGIREPLYITALKYAEVPLEANTELQRIQELKLSEMQIAKVRDWFLQEQKIKDSKKEIPILNVEELNFGYTSEKHNLVNVDFTVHRGEMISIVGKNGAGKSTLAKLLCGFEKVNTGTISHMGRDLVDDTIKERAQYIGYVMQNPNQMISKPLIYEEVALSLEIQKIPPDIIKERVHEALKTCGL